MPLVLGLAALAVYPSKSEDAVYPSKSEVRAAASTSQVVTEDSRTAENLESAHGSAYSLCATLHK